MKICRLLFTVLAFVTLTFNASPVSAQPVRGEDLVDVPAIGDELFVSNTFQSNMVLQRDKPIAIWGWAAPGEKITVTFADNTASATAGKDRAWKVTLPAQPANKKPQTVTIKGKSKTLTLDNILLGDVWILGGQSNMEHPIRAVENGGLEIASANYPDLRILTIPMGQLTKPASAFARKQEWHSFFRTHYRKGYWDVCSPKTVRELSAIGYAFARRVHKAADVPVGVIDLSRGGTSVDSWVPLETLRQMDKPWIKLWLAEWDKKVAAFDPQQDLEQRIKNKKRWIEQMKKEGRSLAPEQLVLPTTLDKGPIDNMNHPGACYHGMLKSVKGLAIKGVIWHQGYNQASSSINGPWMHDEVMPVLIESWRKAFGDPKMPFCIISQCTDGEPQTLKNYSEKMLDLGIEVRESHYNVFRKLYDAGDKNIGFASSYDLRRAWYHPQVKIPAGERAARWALATQYGFSERDVPWNPPIITKMEIKDGAVLLTFNMQVGDQQRGAMQGFAIAGKDRAFHPAVAEYIQTGTDSRNRPQYDKRKIKLTSLMVPEPVAYRYGWGRNPLGNVQAEGNKDLPLATQRSDDWPVHSVPLGVLPEGVKLPANRGDLAKVREALSEMDKQRKIAEAKQVLKELVGELAD